MPDESPLRQAAFDRLFEQHELTFRLHARALLPSWDAVDEVMQIASLIMWKKIEQVDGAEGFLPWGKVIIRFESQKYYRTRARDALVFDPDLLDLLAKHVDEQPEPDLTSEYAALERCLSALGQASRKLVLAPYRDHGYLTELAKATDRTRNSLYKQIRRIRAKLEICVIQQLEGS